MMVFYWPGLDFKARKIFMNIEDIKRLPISELNELGKKLDVPGASGMRRQELIFAILQTQAEQNGVISGSGVLEILPDGFGFYGP